MEQDILSVVSAGECGFSKSQRAIAKFLLESYSTAAFMTAGKLACAAGVSESTVVRFAQELGYGSYPEMRKALADVVRGRLTAVQRIRAAQGLIESGDILTHVLSSDIEQIRLTMESVDRDEFERAVSAIVSAKNIYIFGLRSASAISHFMGYYFNLLLANVRVVSESSPLEVFEQIVHMGEGDLLLALSFPRYSTRTLRAMRYAREWGATVVGITDSPSSPVAKSSDIVLRARSDMVSFLDTLVAPLSLMNALIVAVSERSGADIYSNFERLERLWDEFEVYKKTDE
ncbi:MAG: MurR/RpiR family transcriptional regulator [Oscillospiraceae bacterium]|jgi:DNA-binding MurR/RpiR family transcriptional regulator|nr:MurR/RpiR family transcriptional regulator [Oscillospiraceae bacterium]